MWEYEKEIRVFKEKQGEIQYNIKALKEVIFGWKTTKDDIDLVTNIIMQKGRIEDVMFSGWVIDIGGPYRAFLPLMECPRFVDKFNRANKQSGKKQFLIRSGIVKGHIHRIYW